jgi:enoyl-CoA hydratase/carnithine racemase/N-acetylglutamate synthase-like GNAT family acetyltransferase
MTAVHVRRANPTDHDDIVAMLGAAGLPVDDLVDNTSVPFWVAEIEGRTVGAVGLERFGPDGLLRSLVVMPEARSRGAGAALVESLERDARTDGVSRLLLLTQTAEAFFARLGYEHVTRDQAPPAMRAHPQFLGLCPSSAVCMAKPIAAVPEGRDAAAAGPCVLQSRHGGIVRITLNRGSRYNPLSLEMIEALDRALEGIGTDPSARVIVLAAAGKGFCAGHDLKEMLAHRSDPGWTGALFDACSRLMIRITKLPQPVIARVHGIATAAGCQLVAMCDLAVAADTATFALPGVNIGVFCSTPAVGVSRNVGRKRAMEMLLTGDPVDARQAVEWGLVNRAVPIDQLDATVQHYADRIVARSGKVIGLGKRAFYEQVETSVRDAYDIAGATMTCNLGLDDAAEGIDAFLGKRPPEWSHS